MPIIPKVLPLEVPCDLPVNLVRTSSLFHWLQLCLGYVVTENDSISMICYSISLINITSDKEDVTL